MTSDKTTVLSAAISKQVSLGRLLMRLMATDSLQEIMSYSDDGTKKLPYDQVTIAVFVVFFFCRCLNPSGFFD